MPSAASDLPARRPARHRKSPATAARQHRHLAAQRAQQAGEFDRHVAAADDRHTAVAARSGQTCRPIPAQVESRQIQSSRSRTRGDDDVRGLQRVPSPSSTVCSSTGPGAPPHDAGRGQALVVAAGNSVDVAVAQLAEMLPIQRASRTGKAVIARQRLIACHCAANQSAFFGTHPRCTQVPPGAAGSSSTTRAPWCAARNAVASPPEPAPSTMRSQAFCMKPPQGKA